MPATDDDDPTDADCPLIVVQSDRVRLVREARSWLRRNSPRADPDAPLNLINALNMLGYIDRARVKESR